MGHFGSRMTKKWVLNETFAQLAAGLLTVCQVREIASVNGFVLLEGSGLEVLRLEVHSQSQSMSERAD